MAFVGQLTAAGNSNMPVAATLYGTCETAAATQEKAVTCAAYDLTTPITGMSIAVKFTNSNTYNGTVTLNINSKGAKNAYRYGTTNIGTNVQTSWPAGAVVLFTYDGTNWVLTQPNYDTNSNTIPSAYCDTAAATAAKTASCSGYALKTNSYLHVIVVNTNTSQTAITLNVNGKGAKAIYINGAASSTSNYTLTAGSYLVFYDGTNYYFRTDDKLPGSAASWQNSLNAMINSLGEGSSAAQAGDYIVAQYAGGGTTTTTYHRRKLSNIFKALSSADVTTALGFTPANSSHTHSYLPLSGGTLTGKLTVGTTSQSAAPTASITVHDTRSYTWIPTSLDKGVNWYFSMAGTPDTSKWWAIQHVNGWTGDYNAWELAGTANNTDERTSPLYVRTGRTTNGWGSWRKIYDTSNKPTAADVGAAASSHTHSYLPLSGGTLTGDLLLKSSTNDSPDIVWKYGDGTEKMRLWSPDSPTAATGPSFRIYKADGTSLYTGTLSLANHTHSYLPLSGGTLTAASAIQINAIDLKQANNNVSSTTWPGWTIKDKNSYSISGFYNETAANGTTGTGMWVYNRNSEGTQTGSGSFVIKVDKAGTVSYGVSNPSALRSAISAAASTHTHAYITNQGRLTTADNLRGDGNLRFTVASSSMTTNKPLFGGTGAAAAASDGQILEMPWDNNGGYDVQLAVKNNGAGLSIRGGTGKTGSAQNWTTWAPVAMASAAISNITRSGTTFTATRADGTTFTFTQQDNNTTYTAGTGLSLSSNKFSVSTIPIANGGTGQTTRVAGMNALSNIGNNAITSTANDTTAKWGAFGNGVSFYSTASQITDQPTQYGYVINICPSANSEVHQIWATQASGNMYHRGGNSSGWSGTWRKILDSANTTVSTATIKKPSAGTAIAADDITAWTTNTPTAVTSKTVVTSASGATAAISKGVLTLTNGSFSTGASCTVTAGTAASLSYTARSIPNISLSDQTVVTGVTIS